MFQKKFSMKKKVKKIQVEKKKKKKILKRKELFKK